MRGTPTQRAIIQQIADSYGYPPKLLMTKFVRGRPGHARQHLMAELYATGRWSLPQIGNLFDCDHTTILFGIRRHVGRNIEATTGDNHD